MLKFVPQGWKGEISWAWSCSCGMDLLHLVLSQHLMAAGGGDRNRNCWFLMQKLRHWNGEFAGEALGLQARGAWTKGIAHLAAGAPTATAPPRNVTAQMYQLCVLRLLRFTGLAALPLCEQLEYLQQYWVDSP